MGDPDQPRDAQGRWTSRGGWIVGAGVGLVLAAMAAPGAAVVGPAGAGGSVPGAAAPGGTTTEFGAGLTRPARIGQAAQVAGAEFTATRVVTVRFGPSGQRRVRVTLRVRSDSDGPQNIRGCDQQLTDTAGHVTYGGRAGLTLPPRSTAVVTVEFPLAAGAEPSEVKVRPESSPFGTRIALQP